MRQYSKPTFEITKITTNVSIAAGSPVATQVGTSTDGQGNPITIYEITSFEQSSSEN